MKKYRSILFTVILISLFSSCSDWLTLSPEDGVIREEFWKTKEQVNSAVIGCYSSVQNGPVEKMFLWGEVRADMVDNGISPYNNYTQIIDGEISATNSVVDWQDFYTVINNCNTVLKFAPTVSALDGTFTNKQLKSYEAEALTLRALMYFYLVRSFKDVPLVLEASVSDNQNYSIPKTDGIQILDTLVRDLKIAVLNAPDSYSSIAQNKSRITSWTAKTLLADIYLWQEKYTLCNSLCDEIIKSGKFAMIPVSKSTIVLSNNDIIIDSIFVASESDADRMFASSYIDGNSIESIFEFPFTIQKTNPFYAMLGASNNRLIPKVQNVEGTIFPLPQYESYGQATDIRGSGCSYKLGFIWKYVGASRSGNDVRPVSQYTTPWLVYKYSDVLLMKAEALNQIGLQSSGDPKEIYKEAIANMKIVRSARNAVATPGYIFTDPVDGKLLESSILEERAREFAFEGKRWYDVLRFAKRGNYSNINYLLDLAIRSASPQKQESLKSKYEVPSHLSHYWPIYNNELEVNKALKQNEFYAQ